MPSVYETLQPFVEEVVTRVGYSSLRENEALDFIEPILKRWITRTDWLHEDFFHCSPDQEKIIKLYQGSNDGLMILAISFGKDFIPIPHNHNAWAVVGIASGVEQHIFYECEENSPSGLVKLKQINSQSFHSGEVICMRAEDIHSVENVTANGDVAISLHVYEKNLDTTERSQFDLDTHQELPYSLDYIV